MDIETEGIPSPLQIFSQIGGLALLAEHLPLVYPEPQQSTPSSAVSPFSPPPQLESEWVKVDATDDIYMVKLIYSRIFFKKRKVLTSKTCQRNRPMTKSPN